MKKVILGFAAAALVLSCKKVPEGGNTSVLKLDSHAEHYSDDVQEGGVQHAAHATKETIKVEVNGEELSAYKGGLEESIVAFLKGNGYANAADDAALKDQWYNFDNVNFKTGSATELEAGKEQLANLAKILKAYPDAKIKIGGYTDKTGNEEANKKLSTERANFIKAELTKAGVGAQVVSAEGYGSEHATVDASASDAERAIDRKMAIRFTK